MSDVQPPERKPGPNTVAVVQPRAQGGQWQAADNRRQLTELQAAFAVAYAENGGNASRAAVVAGYAQSSAKDIGARLVRLPWVARAIDIERRRFLNEADLASLRYVVDVVRDTKADPKLRLKAAEVALKAAARDQDGQKNPDGAGKRMGEMTLAELEALVRRLNEAAELAQQPILEHNEQPTAADTTQPIDPPE